MTVEKFGERRNVLTLFEVIESGEPEMAGSAGETGLPAEGVMKEPLVHTGSDVRLFVFETCWP
jgi:hypothetical protein